MVNVISPMRRYPPVGRCIYCGAAGVQLTDEHIVPLSLGGRLILPKASCQACGKITGGIEGACTQQQLGHFRRRIGMRSRHRKKWQSDVAFDVLHEDDTIERKTIPAEQFPQVLSLLKLSPPEVLSGEKAGTPEAWVLYNMHDVEGARKHGGRGFTAGIFDVQAFCRMLAKIAHAYAVAECGPDEFAKIDPLLPDFILRGGANPFSFVGGESVELPGEAFMFRIGCFHHPMGARNYLGVFLRLFAFIDATPLYRIAVADITSSHSA